MTDFTAHWKKILSPMGTQNVDFIVSLDEKGINHFLEKHHAIDNIVYTRKFTKVFNSHNDKREFVVYLNISKPIQLQFPPFEQADINSEYADKLDWYRFDTKKNGPELTAPNDGEPNFQLYCNEVNITIEWPKLDGSGKWKFSLKPFNVFAEANIQLNHDNDGYFLNIIPTLLKLDISRQDVSTLINNEVSKLSNELKIEFDECQEKFTDLFIIAANIALTEQTPKLVRNIPIPVPVLADRPIIPALLNLSDNLLSIGFGLDKEKLEKTFNDNITKSLHDLESNLNKDIEKNGGLLKLVSANYTTQTDFNDIIFLSESEIIEKLTNLNGYINSLKQEMTVMRNPIPDDSPGSTSTINDAFAIGVNEYFFDTIASSIIPAPKHKCTDWLDIRLAKGRVCHWTKLQNPDIQIKPTGELVGGINVDIGGAVEGCIKKVWDCSWEWKCSKLSLAIKGRPQIKLMLLNSSGIRFLAQLDGRLYLDTNLPWPFNEIVKAVSGIIWKFIETFLNIILAALSFIVIKPEFSLPQQKTKIKLKNFSPFYYERPQIEGNTSSKNKFIGYKGGILAES